MEGGIVWPLPVVEDEGECWRCWCGECPVCLCGGCPVCLCGGCPVCWCEDGGMWSEKVSFQPIAASRGPVSHGAWPTGESRGRWQPHMC